MFISFTQGLLEGGVPLRKTLPVPIPLLVLFAWSEVVSSCARRFHQTLLVPQGVVVVMRDTLVTALESMQNELLSVQQYVHNGVPEEVQEREGPRWTECSTWVRPQGPSSPGVRGGPPSISLWGSLITIHTRDVCLRPRVFACHCWLRSAEASHWWSEGISSKGYFFLQNFLAQNKAPCSQRQGWI